MSFLDLAKTRYSVRSYSEKKVEEEKLLKILEAGRVAPTACNFQPVKLLVVQEQEGLAKVSKAANVFNAPLVIIVCGEIDKAWVRPFDQKNIADVDASIVTDHMMLQATELGLGSVWICYFKPDVIKQEFNIPDSLEPVNILAIGYGTDKVKSPDRHDTERKALSDIVVKETF